MNRQEVIGFIGQDAVVKDLGQNQVINFNVAYSESYVNKATGEKVTKTIWYECAKWGNNTSVAQWLKKGTQVYISGKPNNRAWINEQGAVVVVNGINVLELTLLGGAKSERTTEPANDNPVPRNDVPPSEPMPIDAEADDLPF